MRTGYAFLWQSPGKSLSARTRWQILATTTRTVESVTLKWSATKCRQAAPAVRAPRPTRQQVWIAQRGQESRRDVYSSHEKINNCLFLCPLLGDSAHDLVDCGFSTGVTIGRLVSERISQSRKQSAIERSGLEVYERCLD